MVIRFLDRLLQQEEEEEAVIMPFTLSHRYPLADLVADLRLIKLVRHFPAPTRLDKVFLVGFRVSSVVVAAVPLHRGACLLAMAPVTVVGQAATGSRFVSRVCFRIMAVAEVVVYVVTLP